MQHVQLKPRPDTLKRLPLVIKTVAGFWALHILARTIIYAFGGRLDTWSDPALLIATVIGVALSFGYCWVLVSRFGRHLTRGLMAAAIASLPLSVGFATAEVVLYYHISPEVNGSGSSRTMPDGTVITQSASGEVTYLRKGESRPTVVKLSPVKERVRAGAARMIASNSSGWYFFFFGLGSFLVGISSAARLREVERRAAEFERLAQAAQLRALRYQVNPHFLFNTLNSLSSLILGRREAEAEAMILSLSEFFRTTLAIDPTDDVTLEEEVALQQLYLNIERARFPDRLHVNVVVPDDLAKAKVPALLLQPIVENAVKYGVARSAGRVELEIRAERIGADALEITVKNSGGSAPGAAHGTGVGLANVCERLTARYGEAASCRFGPREEGGFCVALTLPLLTA